MKLSSVISFLAGVLVFFILLALTLFLFKDIEPLEALETNDKSRNIYREALCHEQENSVKVSEEHYLYNSGDMLPDEKNDSAVLSRYYQEQPFASNFTNDQSEQSISDILDYGLTQDQINSFVEDDNPNQIFSNLHEEIHLIPSVLNKISLLQASTYRNYLLALINGLPEQQRLLAANELLTSTREIDQNDAQRIINLSESSKEAFDEAQYQHTLENLSQHNNLKVIGAMTQLKKLLNDNNYNKNRQVISTVQQAELENALQDIASNNQYDLELRYSAMALIKRINER